MESTLHDAGQIFSARNAIDALAERPADLKLVGIEVKVHFLMRMTTVVVGLNVPDDSDQRNRVERGIRDTRDGVRQPRPDVEQQNARLPGNSRVSIGGVRRELFMARRNEPNATPTQGVKHLYNV